MMIGHREDHRFPRDSLHTQMGSCESRPHHAQVDAARLQCVQLIARAEFLQAEDQMCIVERLDQVSSPA